MRGIGHADGAQQDIDAALLFDPDVAARMDKTRDWLQMWAIPGRPRDAFADDPGPP